MRRCRLPNPNPDHWPFEPFEPEINSLRHSVENCYCLCRVSSHSDQGFSFHRVSILHTSTHTHILTYIHTHTHHDKVIALSAPPPYYVVSADNFFTRVAVARRHWNVFNQFLALLCGACKAVTYILGGQPRPIPKGRGPASPKCLEPIHTSIEFQRFALNWAAGWGP